MRWPDAEQIIQTVITVSPIVGLILAQLRALPAANSRRTAWAFSASESGSVAIMAIAAAKLPLPSFVSGVQAGVQSRFLPFVSD